MQLDQDLDSWQPRESTDGMSEVSRTPPLDKVSTTKAATANVSQPDLRRRIWPRVVALLLLGCIVIGSIGYFRVFPNIKSPEPVDDLKDSLMVNVTDLDHAPVELCDSFYVLGYKKINGVEVFAVKRADNRGEPLVLAHEDDGPLGITMARGGKLVFWNMALHTVDTKSKQQHEIILSHSLPVLCARESARNGLFFSVESKVWNPDSKPGEIIQPKFYRLSGSAISIPVPRIPGRSDGQFSFDASGRLLVSTLLPRNRMAYLNGNRGSENDQITGLVTSLLCIEKQHLSELLYFDREVRSWDIDSQGNVAFVSDELVAGARVNGKLIRFPANEFKPIAVCASPRR